MDLKIVGWTWYDNPEYQEKYPIGSTCSTDEFDYVRQIVVNEVRSKGYHFTGSYHQAGEYGVPVFSDGTTYQCSQRFWGGIMASAYPDEIDDSDGLGYVEWAWMAPGDMKIPSPDGYDVER